MVRVLIGNKEEIGGSERNIEVLGFWERIIEEDWGSEKGDEVSERG